MVTSRIPIPLAIVGLAGAFGCAITVGMVAAWLGTSELTLSVPVTMVAAV